MQWSDRSSPPSTSKRYNSAAKSAMLKRDVGHSLAFNVHSLCLYFHACTLQSAFRVSSLCKCRPFENVKLSFFCMCVHACILLCAVIVQDCGGLSGNCKKQAGLQCSGTIASSLFFYFYSVLLVFIWDS